MKLERIEDIIGTIENHLAEPNEDWWDVLKEAAPDLLSLLDKKFAQIKAGEDKAVKLTGGFATAPVAETSPGLSADERALVLLEELCSRAGVHGNNWFMPKEYRTALAYLRSRLAAGIEGLDFSYPKPAPPTVKAEEMPGQDGPRYITDKLYDDEMRAAHLRVVSGQPAPPVPPAETQCDAGELTFMLPKDENCGSRFYASNTRKSRLHGCPMLRTPKTHNFCVYFQTELEKEEITREVPSSPTYNGHGDWYEGYTVIQSVYKRCKKCLELMKPATLAYKEQSR